MNDQSFEETAARLCDKDSRYDMEAYYFIRDALGYATRKFNRTSANKHVTGAELSDAVREFAIREFGPLAYLVLTEWGLNKTSDFGEIVYSLINEGVLGKSESDRKEDFTGIFDFTDAFIKPFEPGFADAVDKSVKTRKKKKAED